MRSKRSERQHERGATCGTTRWWQYRRLARCLPAVLLVGCLAALVAYLGADNAAAGPGGGVECEGPRDAAPGSALPWEAAIPVSTYSVANADGNLLTTIPIIGWSGVGPDIQMNLYHSSAAVETGMSNTDKSLGFRMPRGWSCSYSAHIDFPPGIPATAQVVADDGTRVVYTEVGGQWVAPDGIHDVLTDNGIRFTLTHKNQSFHEFDMNGALVRFVGATGHEVAIDSVGASTTITDAAGRQLLLDKGAWGLWTTLVGITDPNEGDPVDAYNPTRSWQVALDTEQTNIKTITDPRGAVITLSYDRDERISEITDAKLPGEDTNTYAYEYLGPGNQVVKVTDPAPDNLTQLFSYVCSYAQQVHRVTYTDRRGKDWVQDYDFSMGTFESSKDPLGNEWTFQHDADKNMTKYRDPLNNEWTYTYDGNGNMLTATDPLDNTTTYTYNSDNNVTTIVDAMAEVTTLNYEHPNPAFSTLLTSVVEPEVEGSVATTVLGYYEGVTGQFDGMLASIRDPNGVLTAFEYDQWGQLKDYGEGETTPGGSVAGMTIVKRTVADSSSRVIWSYSNGSSARSLPFRGEARYDLVNNMTESSCPYYLEGGGCCEGAPPLNPPAGFPTLPSQNPPFGMRAETPLGSDITYDGLSRMTSAPFTVRYGPLQTLSETRTTTAAFNELGFLAQATVTSSQTGSPRTFTYTYDLANGTYTRTGPDGVQTVVQVDDAGRVASFWRGLEGVTQKVMSAYYTYTADGRVETVTYLNGKQIVYEYDAARRLDRIRHFEGYPNNPMIESWLDYSYNDNNEITQIDEWDGQNTYRTTFGHDARGRLAYECRATAPFSSCDVYELTYRYDDGGNRTEKIDALHEDKWVYEYDITADPTYTYDTKNNRLMYIQYFDTEGAASDLQAETWYYYNSDGNPVRIVTSVDGETQYTATRFDYAANGSAVAYVVGESWDESDPTGTYAMSYAREFRYDSGRQRYLNRTLDADQMDNGVYQVAVDGDTWTDYDGDEPYGDFTMVGANAVSARSFEAGIATVDPWVSSGSTNTSYYHGNQIGSTWMMSDGTGTYGPPTTYTAFGERISGTNHRYGYAGAYGYQQHSFDEVSPGGDPDAVFPYMHVGARYYDPATGRFLQRDPIGIRGGLNVYAYVLSRPNATTDPRGLAGPDAGFFGKMFDWFADLWPKNSRNPNGTFGKAPWPRRFFKGAGKGLGVLGLCIGAAQTGWWVGELLVEYTDIEDHIGEYFARTYPVPPDAHQPKPICVRGCHNDNMPW